MTRRILIVVISALAVHASLLAPGAGGQEPTSTSTSSTTTSTTTPITSRPTESPEAVTGTVPPAPTGVTGDPLDGGASLGWAPTIADPPVTRYVIRRDGDVVARSTPGSARSPTPGGWPRRPSPTPSQR